MYHTMLPPHMMVQIVGGQQANGQCPPVQTNPRPVSDVNNNNNNNNNTNNNNTQHYNRTVSYFANSHGQDRHRLMQKHTHPLELYQIMGVEIPPNRRGAYARQNGIINNSGNSSGDWQRRNNTSYNIHKNGINSLTIAPPHLNYRPNNYIGSTKKSSWNNKYSKRNNNAIKDNLTIAQSEINSYNSDSGISSRSPTPNKQACDNSTHAESSDDRESVSSCNDQEMKGFTEAPRAPVIQNIDTLSAQGIMPHIIQQHYYYNPRTLNIQHDLNLNNATRTAHIEQNYQGKKRYAGKATPLQSLQKNQRNRKYSGILIPSFNFYPKTFIIPDRFDAKSIFIQPSKLPDNLICHCPWDVLSKDVWKKFITNQQTENTYRKKIMLWKYLLIYLKSIFPKYGLYLVGSTMNGFGSDNSDVDICLLIRNTDLIPRTEAVWHLDQVMHSLQHHDVSDVIEGIELIPAKVPILKFRDRIQNLDVDLNCNNCVGVRNTHLLYCYSQIDWRVRPLVLVVKLWAQIQDINDAKYMTISSYSLVLMVIHFLQCGVNPPILPCLHSLFSQKFHPHTDIHLIDVHEDLNLPAKPSEEINHQPLGELLFEFLKYYTYFDFKSYAISVRTARRLPIDQCRFARSWKNHPNHWTHLGIEEPFDLTNTARSVYNRDEFLRIQSVFHWSYKTLQEKRNLASIFVTHFPRPKTHYPRT